MGHQGQRMRGSSTIAPGHKDKPRPAPVHSQGGQVQLRGYDQQHKGERTDVMTVQGLDLMGASNENRRRDKMTEQS